MIAWLPRRRKGDWPGRSDELRGPRVAAQQPCGGLLPAPAQADLEPLAHLVDRAPLAGVRAGRHSAWLVVHERLRAKARIETEPAPADQGGERAPERGARPVAHEQEVRRVAVEGRAAEEDRPQVDAIAERRAGLPLGAGEVRRLFRQVAE